MRLRVVLKPDPEDGGFNVSCPRCPDVIPGDTIDEPLEIFVKRSKAVSKR